MVDMIIVDRREEWYERAAKHLCKKLHVSYHTWSPTELILFIVHRKPAKYKNKDIVSSYWAGTR